MSRIALHRVRFGDQARNVPGPKLGISPGVESVLESVHSAKEPGAKLGARRFELWLDSTYQAIVVRHPEADHEWLYPLASAIEVVTLPARLAPKPEK